MEIVVAKKILKASEQIAVGNRAFLDRAGVCAVNILGSPGCGKTTLLEALIASLDGKARLAVIEGDLASTHDAQRIEAAGVPAVQINTDGGCHLDANMIASALGSLDVDTIDLLFIENVGNLVCTAGFDLGERVRVAVLSVAEGDDKVIKYPPIFQSADAVIISKIDMMPYTDFDVERFDGNLRRLKADSLIFQVSARTGQGIPEFVNWLLSKRS
jgi:hydrogenase nickel incorporation protein HypB